MWQVYIDKPDVIEVCNWGDVSEVVASGNHEGTETARERYAHYQVRPPRPLHAGAGALHCVHVASETRRQEMDARIGRLLDARVPVPTGRHDLVQ